MVRRTNLGLLLLLAVTLATGTVGLAVDQTPSRWALIGHGTAAFGLIMLMRPKVHIIHRGLRRHPATRYVSLLLAGLLGASFGFGLLHTTGLLRDLRGYTSLAWHIALGLLALPLLLWHVAARRTRVRRTDLSRRSLLRAGMVLGGGAAAYAALEGALRVANLPGARRALTGSYAVGSADPAAMPVTQWLFDDVVDIDQNSFVLTIRDLNGSERHRRLSELAAHGDAVDAVLDCTGGWFAQQRWEGAWLHRLLPDPGDARSVVVRAATGYSRRFPIDELPRLLLATRVGGKALSAAHGAPARLVAPDRRGFWWVKWVSVIELSRAPSWWQPPFPLQ